MSVLGEQCTICTAVRAALGVSRNSQGPRKERRESSGICQDLYMKGAEKMTMLTWVQDSTAYPEKEMASRWSGSLEGGPRQGMVTVTSQSPFLASVGGNAE